MNSAPHLNILEAMDLEDKVTGYYKKMWSELVPASQPVTPQAPNYIMQTAQEQVQALQTPKKETLPEEIWELRKLFVCCICNINKI